MFFGKRQRLLRPSKAYQSPLQKQPSDQLPFLSRARFSALPQFRLSDDEPENLSLFIAVLYVIDLFGVFPFVTLPGLLVELGFLGIPLVISIVVLQIYTSFLLSQCWTMAESLDPSIVQKIRYPYAAIAELAYGPYMSLLVTVLLDLSIFSAGIPMLVMASQNLELVVHRISGGQYEFSYCYWVIIVGLIVCPLMWLASPKHMRNLTLLSAGVMIVIVVLLWYCLFAASPIGRPFEDFTFNLPPFLTLLNGYSLLAFQFDIHPVLLTLQIDMQEKSQVSWAAFFGIAVTCTIAVFGSIVAAYKFGSMIADNILQTLPNSIPLYCVATFMSLQLCFSTVVGSSAMFLPIENYFKIPEALSFRRIVLRSSMLALELLIAEFVPRFDVLQDIVGGTITGPLVFILPPLLYRRIRSMKRAQQRIAAEVVYGTIPLDLNYDPTHVELQTLLTEVKPNTMRALRLRTLRMFKCLQCDLSFSMMVLFFGIVATFLATYLNLFTVSDLFHNNSPCFGNLTNSR